MPLDHYPSIFGKSKTHYMNRLKKYPFARPGRRPRAIEVGQVACPSARPTTFRDRVLNGPTSGRFRAVSHHETRERCSAPRECGLERR